MFEIGDKVVHPMHGAGIIEGIEVKEILEKNSNIIYSISHGRDEGYDPHQNVEEIGVREVISHTDISKLVHVLSHPSDTLPDN